jgi:lactobin A/cerein 7B family class IIb bacteriocin
MKNLQNFGVQELNSKEMENINGGGFWTNLAILALFIISTLVVNNVANQHRT